jgi:phage terminase large subunit-like protein
MVRLNAVADLFASGTVWAPDTRWAREVIEEIAAFPVGEHDDYVDTTTQALLRYRQGGFIALDSDEQEDLMYRIPRRAAYY